MNRQIIISSEFIQKAKYDLSAQQTKLLHYIISEIDDFFNPAINEDYTAFVPKTIDIKSFCETFSIAPNSSNIKYISDNLLKMKEKQFSIDGNSYFWFSELDINENIATVKLNDVLIPYLFISPFDTILKAMNNE